MEKDKRKFPLSLKREVINLGGKMSYNDSAQAWNLIRLKEDFLKQLPKLKEKRANIFYKMIYHFSYDDIIKALKEMRENDEPLPILLLFEEMSSG